MVMAKKGNTNMGSKLVTPRAAILWRVPMIKASQEGAGTSMPRNEVAHAPGPRRHNQVLTETVAQALRRPPIRRRDAVPAPPKAAGAEVAAEAGVEARRNSNILVNSQRENTGTGAEALVAAADLRNAKGRERRKIREGKKSRRKRIRRRNEVFLPGKRSS